MRPDAVEAQNAASYYPPALTGMRGSHPGSFEEAHALRDGREPGTATDTGEAYDLVVVGGGISGLSAAHFFRNRTSAAARILILDNHDDFGGHAKRNEFQLGGRLHLMNGGTLEIDSPRPYAPVPQALLTELGIDVPQLSRKVEHPKFYESLGMHHGVFFDRETFGADKLVSGYTVRAGAHAVGGLTVVGPRARGHLEDRGELDRLHAGVVLGREEAATVEDQLLQLPA